MTKKQVLAEAMSLSEKDRELLALELWRSLDGTTQEEAAQAWAEEISRRLKALDRGEIKSVPAEQVIREARKLVRKKRSA